LACGIVIAFIAAFAAVFIVGQHIDACIVTAFFKSLRALAFGSVAQFFAVAAQIRTDRFLRDAAVLG
jgi:hypothetical protein